MDGPPAGGIGPEKLNLPMRIDEAPGPFSHWLGTFVVNKDWRVSYLASGEVAIKEGYDLEWFWNNKKAGVELLIANGILPGIAEQWVNKIMDWVNVITAN